MNSAWLAQLAPEHAPAPPGWWPPAPGWWLCAVLLAGVSTALIVWWRDPHRRLRRTALRELRAIRARALATADTAATARAVENLLRRYALALFGADATARLTGEPWLAFMHAHGAPAAADSWGPSLLAACFGPVRAEFASGEVGGGGARAAECERWLAGAETFLRRAGRTARRDRSAARRPVP